jgi:hypothetical protein
VPATTTTAPVGPPVAPAEVQALVQAFVADFNTATTSGDTDWLYDHLAPAVIEAYGEETCRAHVEDVIVEVRDLALQGPVLGPIGQQVDVPRPGGGSVVIDLTSLYAADITFVFGGETSADTGWVQLVADPQSASGQSPAYFAQCAPAP